MSFSTFIGIFVVVLVILLVKRLWWDERVPKPKSDK